MIQRDVTDNLCNVLTYYTPFQKKKKNMSVESKSSQSMTLKLVI